MSLCYFSLVSHYKRNAVLLDLFKISLKTFRLSKRVKKQHFDIIVGKLRISFIDAG